MAVPGRTIQGRRLPGTGPLLDEPALAVLVQERRLFSVRCCGVVPALGRLHLLLWVEDTEQLARFLAYAGSEPGGLLHEDFDPEGLTGSPSMAYSLSVWFVETSVFSGQLSKLLDDDGYWALQLAIALRPEQGALISGSGGLRKLRWSVAGRGKRGGLRVIYYWDQADSSIYLLYLYAKNRQEDLTPDQLKLLRRLIQEDFR